MSMRVNSIKNKLSAYPFEICFTHFLDNCTCLAFLLAVKVGSDVSCRCDNVTLIVIPVCCLDTPRPHLLQLRRLQRGLGLPRGGPGVGAAGRRPPSRHARPLAGLRAAAVRPTPARAAHRNTALAGIPFTVHFLASASDC